MLLKMSLFAGYFHFLMHELKKFDSTLCQDMRDALMARFMETVSDSRKMWYTTNLLLLLLLGPD